MAQNKLGDTGSSFRVCRSVLLAMSIAAALALTQYFNRTNTVPKERIDSSIVDHSSKQNRFGAGPGEIAISSEPATRTPLPTSDSIAPAPTPATERHVRFDELPEELSNLWIYVYLEIAYGNFDQAAHTAHDALELAAGYPHIRTELHYQRGWSYQNLGYTDMAIEEYKRALSINPQHRLSHTALRRIDSEFAMANDELPPVKTQPPKAAAAQN